MAGEEKLKQTLLNQPFWMLMLVLFCFLMAVAATRFFFYLKRARKEKRLLFNHVKPIDISGEKLTLFLIFLILVGCFSGLTILFYPVTMAGVLFLLKSHQTDVLKLWGMRRFSLSRLIFISVWLCLAILPFLTLISFLVEEVSEFLHKEPEPQQAVQMLLSTQNIGQLGLLLFSAIILAPIAEEMLFRGLLYPYFKSRMSQRAAMIFTSLFFAYIHFHLFTFLQLFVFGLILIAVFEQTGSLALCMGLHMSFNALNAIWLLIIKSLS